jgi:hypothetical protein
MALVFSAALTASDQMLLGSARPSRSSRHTSTPNSASASM